MNRNGGPERSQRALPSDDDPFEWSDEAVQQLIGWAGCPCLEAAPSDSGDLGAAEFAANGC